MGAANYQPDIGIVLVFLQNGIVFRLILGLALGQYGLFGYSSLAVSMN